MDAIHLAGGSGQRGMAGLGLRVQRTDSSQVLDGRPQTTERWNHLGPEQLREPWVP